MKKLVALILVVAICLSNHNCEIRKIVAGIPQKHILRGTKVGSLVRKSLGNYDGLRFKVDFHCSFSFCFEVLCSSLCAIIIQHFFVGLSYWCDWLSEKEKENRRNLASDGFQSFVFAFGYSAQEERCMKVAFEMFISNYFVLKTLIYSIKYL